MVISDVSQVLDFYPRPPRGGRHGRAGGVLLLDLFLSTPSARRATSKGASAPRAIFYFYPRPPRGGRQFYDEEECLEHEFLSTPSARRATRSLALAFRSPRNFYPRPPRGGRPRLRVLDPFVLEISIHALREEGDDDPADDRIPIVVISIHALREEGDQTAGLFQQSADNFYPRPPRGGRLLRIDTFP